MQLSCFLRSLILQLTLIVMWETADHWVTSTKQEKNNNVLWKEAISVSQEERTVLYFKFDLMSKVHFLSKSNPEDLNLQKKFGACLSNPPLINFSITLSCVNPLACHPTGKHPALSLHTNPAIPRCNLSPPNHTSPHQSLLCVVKFLHWIWPGESE